MNFLQREQAECKFLAVEKLTLLYTFVTTLLIIIFYNRLSDPQEMFLGRFFILTGTFAIIYAYTKFPTPLMRVVRIVAQMSLLSYWYPETFEFNRIFPNLDHIFATADQVLFGCQPAVLFEQVCSGDVWREAFNLGYFSYYPMIVTAVFCYIFVRPKEVERCTFIIMSSFFIYYLIYMFLPVAGPQFYYPVIDADIVACGPFPEIGNYFNQHPEISIAQEGKGGLFTSLVNMAQASGERPTAAFPSSHIGVSTIIMLLTFRAKKGVFIVLFPLYVLLCCATVYIKAHYLVDAIGGIASGIALYLLTAFIFDRYLETSKGKRISTI